MQKLAKKLSLVMVALFTVFTLLSYVPASAAVATPKLQMVSQPAAEYKVGDRITFTVTSPNFGGKVEYRVICYNGTTKTTTNLWNTPATGYYYKGWQPAGSYVFPITWVVTKDMQPGAYSLTVLVRRVGAKVAYDSHIDTKGFWVKDSSVESIAPVADVTVVEGAKPVLPTTVTLNMVDKTTKTENVTWDAVDTTKVGTVTVNGTVAGTDKKAAVKVTVTAAKLTAEVKAVGAKKLEVKFNKAVVDTTLTLKKGLVPYPVTTTWNETKTVATLTYAYDFSAGDYTVTAPGMETGATVTVAAPKVSKIELTDSYLPLRDNYLLGYKVYNQYSEEMTVVPSALNISVYNVTKALPISVVNPTTAPELDLVTATAVKDNQVIITITHTATGVNVSKVLTVNTAATVAQMQFGTVAPLTDKVRISVSENGFVLPYTFADQYGAAIKLTTHTANADTVANVETIDGIQFMTSNIAIVNPDTFVVDSTGKLTFNTGATAGTAIITAIVPSTGATGYFTVKVEAAGALKTFSMNGPAELVVEGETVKVPYIATNTFDSVIATKDFTFGGSVAFVSSNPAVVNTATDIAFNAKTGELEIAPSGNGLVTLYATVGGVLQNSIVLDVKALALPTRVTGLVNVPTLFQNGASKTLSAANVTVIDQYNRAIDLGTYATDVYTVAVTAKDGSANNVTIANPSITASSTNTAIAGAAIGTVGTEELVFTLQNDGVNVADSAYTVAAKTIAAADIKSYSLNEVPTIYGAYATYALANTAGHAKVLVLVGKDAAGSAVTVDQSIITSITSSDLAVVGVDNTNKAVFGVAKGTSVVAAWQGATKLAEVTVTASDVAPVAKTAALDATSYTVAALATIDLGAELTVKDQYGAVMASPVGVWASSNTAKATVNPATGVVTGVAAGTTTISFVTSNGIAVSVEVDVTP